MRTFLALLVAVAFQHVEAQSAKADTYLARLTPLNISVTKGETTGEAKFTINGDNLTITVDVKNAPDGIAHLQHFHGFKTGDKKATCPTAEADANHDGIIDLIETEPVAGTTMVPFHDDPVSMKIPSETYPKASADGSYHYEKTVSLKALKEAFAKAFGGQDLALDRRVVFIHGIAPDTKLSPTVASLGSIPAQVTLPIACGMIEKAG
jgi:Cu/Zn superoxide dismutase